MKNLSPSAKRSFMAMVLAIFAFGGLAGEESARIRMAYIFLTPILSGLIALGNCAISLGKKERYWALGTGFFLVPFAFLAIFLWGGQIDLADLWLIPLLSAISSLIGWGLGIFLARITGFAEKKVNRLDANDQIR